MKQNESTHTPRRRYEIAVAGVIFLLASSYFTYAAAWSYWWQSKANTSFVTVNAMVVEASIKSRGSSSTTHGSAVFPYIVYEYRFNGKHYRNDRYYFAGNGWQDTSSVEAIVSSLKEGSLLTVHVDATRPEMTVIDNGKPTLGILLYLFPMIFLSFVAIFYGLRARK